MVICGAYDQAVKMMGDMNFLSALMNFPKEQVGPLLVQHVIAWLSRSTQLDNDCGL
jgi:hypothetical protein